MSGWPTVEALQIAEKQASKAHDAMWAMDFDKTSAGEFERDQWKRLRDQASKAIWKLHDAIRPALSALATKDSEAVLPRSSAPGLEALEAERRRESYDKGWDAGREDMEQGAVCSVCGHNHDRDESAACEGSEAVTLDEYLAAGPDRADALEAAEAARDQAIKERDEAREALRKIVYASVPVDGGMEASEVALAYIALNQQRYDIARSALAGVPGGSEQGEGNAK